MKEFIINENDADQRVDRFIQKTMKTMPKSLMYKYIRNKKIKVNRKRCEISQRLQVGDTMQCYIPEEFYEVATMRSFLQVPNALDVVYEDDAVLLINKPKGLRAVTPVRCRIIWQTACCIICIVKKNTIQPPNKALPLPCAIVSTETRRGW